jgi:hypothetical protein
MQNPRMIMALFIDGIAALSACSWEVDQVLGANHVAAGYAKVQGMVLTIADDEEGHLECSWYPWLESG